MNILIQGVFSVREDRTIRGLEVTFAKGQCRLDIRKTSFSQRTVNEKNICAHCMGDITVNMFKIESTYTSEGWDTLR